MPQIHILQSLDTRYAFVCFLPSGVSVGDTSTDTFTIYERFGHDVFVGTWRI